MKKKLNGLLIAAIILLSGYSSQAQFNDSEFSLQYNISQGSGNLNDFIGKTSFRGASMSFRRHIDVNWKIGVDIAWNVFYEELGNDVYTSGDVSYSGKQYRYANLVPVFVVPEYRFFDGNKALTPYVGGGIGTIYDEAAVDFGIFRISEDAWHFGFKVHAGFLYKLNNANSLNVNLGYNKGLKTSNLDDIGFFTFGIGLMWPN